MGNFDEAFDVTMKHEGGYSNDPDDAGGETYRGIARRYHPSWPGWNMVDRYKIDSRYSYMPISREADEDLDDQVRRFYKMYFWDINRLDEIPHPIAAELFDTGVNMGWMRAAMIFQKALNYLNRNETLFPDLVVDGRIGPKTISALGTLLRVNPNDDIILLKIMNVLQGMHYLEYMQQSPTQEKYARGWFNRVVMG